MFGLPDFTESRDLHVACEWATKRDHLNDLVLAVLGTAITTCATANKETPLTRVLVSCADAARETALGQFLTEVQGAKAMLRVRKGSKQAWKQGKKMDAVAALLGGQVRAALEQQAELGELPVRGKAVVSVVTQKGDTRRIDLRPPEDGDWELLEIARQVSGERDAHLGTWCSFAMLVICCAQAEAGWFDLVKVRGKSATRKRHRGAHGLVLSDSAHANIKRDIDKWMRLGFVKEPMLVPPEDGDYLTVKHRKVAGGRGPMGAKTDVTDTTAWKVASHVMGATAWTVPEGTLAAIRGGPLAGIAAEAEPDNARRESILACYRRLAQDEFYIPIFADFRGRIYTRSSVVTYQGRDLQKGLLAFPHRGYADSPDQGFGSRDALALHMSALYGGPEKLDKAALPERLEWWRGALAKGRPDMEVIAQAEDPIQLYTAWDLYWKGQRDRIPCQIDGTCNGLQHLSALFRDERAAPFVNLTESSLSDRPSDIYGAVAGIVCERLAANSEPWARRLRAAITIDRKLCKGPVMTLPYGATKATIEDLVFQAMLKQEPGRTPWTYGHILPEGGIYRDWQEGNYEAFKDRDLEAHPLFKLDARRLGGLVWDCIAEVLPKAMEAMQAFRDIAKAVGDRTLEWSTGVGPDPLWVIQAKAKSAATPLHMKGLHLPGSVRGLLIRPGKDEIDAHAHVSGIVANFVHSQDAAHQTRTMDCFGRGPLGHRPFGAIFDCYITRPSLMADLKAATRGAFAAHYTADPLAHPVRLRDPKGHAPWRTDEFSSWYVLAERLGVSFPERGTWKPEEVTRSAWFFS